MGSISSSDISKGSKHSFSFPTALSDVDLTRLSAQRGEEAVKLLKGLTRLLLSPREATKSARRSIGKRLREAMTRNLYLSSEAIDDIVKQVTQAEVPLESLSKWVGASFCLSILLHLHSSYIFLAIGFGVCPQDPGQVYGDLPGLLRGIPPSSSRFQGHPT